MEFTKKVYSTVMILLFLCMSVMTAQAQTNTVKGTVSSPFLISHPACYISITKAVLNVS